MKNFFIFCAVAVIVAGIFGLSYPFAKNLQFGPGGGGITARGSDLVAVKSGKVNSPQVESVRQAQAEIYRDWSMFANDHAGFSIRYPQTLQVSSRAVSQLDYPQLQTIVIFNSWENSDRTGTSITISRLPLADNQNLDEIVKDWREREIILTEKESNVAGLKAWELWVSTPQEGSSSLCEDIVFVKKGDQALVFQSVGIENRPLFSQMLATVKFYF
jgi:hypothetical protein